MDSTHSFEATLSLPDTHVNLLEMLHGKPALATVSSFSGGFFTGRPQTLDHSHLLGMRSHGEGAVAQPLRLDFRATQEGYRLCIKNPGEHYNKLIGKRWLEVFGVTHSPIDTPTAVTLIDRHDNVITRADIKARHTPVSLMTTNNKYIGGLKVRGSPYLYLAETEQKSRITFILSILEARHA
ncbi:MULTISPECIES: hypothetical protein [unclassified Pseudomonas]|uniref:hypothetical protein n=1 Tax=unclassified Pseudomonas TaxID=196821 RepID=UPI001199358B|nr:MULTISPECIES: hypothetical protein [unclassified Pseudomonas]TWC11223.1 hypothetical protein FBY00_1336 [Pseudomonas sp. SJZ075]TWC13001.1 hypothetical protein FBX99_13358 [Pseudomonas sp. SJZ074]TWC29018.1 hypothetical protein FBY02_1256 [Pseudomonas sp. SJZ078]TWC31474.1 hypothetical protein FBY06_13458 [Pseudomonas sp. SJZ085]TWC47585.1 hypothetical protein FBY11_1336 [Pseudomonas sp. SJZ124]